MRAAAKPVAAPFDPTVAPYFVRYKTAKPGYATVVGGDGKTMFVDCPQDSVAEGPTWPGLQTESTTGHASNPAVGYVCDDTLKAWQLQAVNNEAGLKTSNWNGATENGLAAGTGNFMFGMYFEQWGGTVGDTWFKGTGTTFPTLDIENSGGIRVNIGDTGNTLFDGTGTATNTGFVYLTPAPVTGERVLLLCMRDVAAKLYRVWYGKVVPGATRANLMVGDTAASNFYVQTPRNDTRQQVTLKVNEGTAIGDIVYWGGITLAQATQYAGDLLENRVALL